MREAARYSTFLSIQSTTNHFWKSATGDRLTSSARSVGLSQQKPRYYGQAKDQHAPHPFSHFGQKAMEDCQCYSSYYDLLSFLVLLYRKRLDLDFLRQQELPSTRAILLHGPQCRRGNGNIQNSERTGRHYYHETRERTPRRRRELRRPPATGPAQRPSRRTTAALQRQKLQGPTATKTIPLPSCGAYLSRNGHMLSSKEQHYAKTAKSEFDLQDHLQAHHQWSTKTLHDIDWIAYGRARSRLDDEKKVFTTKLCLNWLPVGTRMHRCGASSDECILCGLTETRDHIFQCPHRQEWRDKFITKLDKKLRGLETAADIRHSFISNIQTWLNETPRTDNLAQETTVRHEQTEIGWDKAFLAYISEDWSNSQDSLYRVQGKDQRTRAQAGPRHSFGSYGNSNTNSGESVARMSTEQRKDSAATKSDAKQRPKSQQCTHKRQDYQQRIDTFSTFHFRSDYLSRHDT